MDVPATEFPRFAELPTELREEIWLYCLPDRVLELTVPAAHIAFWRPVRPGPSTKWPCKLSHTSNVNIALPLISRVCHEARALYFKTGITQPDPWEQLDERPPAAQWMGQNESRTWLDRSRDIAHLNWTDAYEEFYTYTDDTNPLDDLAWAASKLSRGGSLMVNAIDGEYGTSDPWLASVRASRLPANPSNLKPSRLQNLKVLEQIEPLRVVMKVVVAHADTTTAAETGLFGLLADARVQLVDVAETAQMQAYYDFAEACERKAAAISPQNFRQEFASAIKKQLQDFVLREFVSKELARRVRPVIMFRLCTRDCNHVVSEGSTSPLLTARA